MSLQINIKKLNALAQLPEYKSEEAAGADLHACLSDEVQVPPYGIALIPTGIAIEIPHGYQGEVRARSGLTLKEGLFVLNGPGTIDSDYRGEVKVILANFTSHSKTIHHMDRIAQLVIMPVIHVRFVESDLADSSRQESGFGSTGR